MRQERRNTSLGGPPQTASFPPYGVSPPFAQHTTLPHIQPSQSQSRKRPFHDIEQAPASGARTLQPRPSTSGQVSSSFVNYPGDPSQSSILSPSEAGDEPARKKRGRPTKDEIQRREAEAAARGEVYAPKKRAPKKPIEPSASSGPSSDPVAASSKLDPGHMPLHLSPHFEQVGTAGAPTIPQSNAPAPESTEPRSPLKFGLAAPSPSTSTEHRLLTGYQSQPPDPHFIHRASSVAPSPIPRYQPSLPPAGQASQPTTEGSGAGMPPNLSSLYDTQERSAP